MKINLICLLKNFSLNAIILKLRGLFIMKIYKLLSVIFSVILCLCLILTTTACKNQENVSSEEYEIVYEYLEESGSDLSSDTSNKNSNSDEDDSNCRR